MNDQSIYKFEETDIAVRNSDNYWNATQMCKVGKKPKLVGDFLRLSTTKAYIKELAEELGIDNSELVQTNRGGSDDQGTWMHRRVALKLAAWLSPKFEVWVYGVIEKLLTEGQVKLENEIDALKEALGSIEAMIEVRELQASEARAEAKYWKEELTLYRESHHPDYQQIGGYQDNSND